MRTRPGGRKVQKSSGHKLRKSKYRRIRQLGAWCRSKAASHTGLSTLGSSEAADQGASPCRAQESPEVARGRKRSCATGPHGGSDAGRVEKQRRCKKNPNSNACAPDGKCAQTMSAPVLAQESSSQTSCGNKVIHGLQRGAHPSPAAGILALRAGSRSASCCRNAARKQETSRPTRQALPAKPKLDVAAEIQRLQAAASPEDILNIPQGEMDDDVVSQAWKQLVLLLHPDKLQCMDAEAREAGAQALHVVHDAKEEMKRRLQQACAEVPLQPLPDGKARLLESASGSRKYEVKWKISESMDPQRPVEKYEVWGPKYFSEAGDSFDWVLLATLPSLQTHFVLVEEAPTQQDVMWAADRVRRQTLPLQVYAANGKGASEALTFDMPWATIFPWLQGTSSVLCPRCCQLSQRRGAWSKCGGCNFSIPTENGITVRCPECQGEVLWSHGGSQLSCTCCLKKFGGAAAQDHLKQPRALMRPGGGGGRGNGGGGRSGGGRPRY